MKRQDELNEAWCKYMGKCSTEILQALAFALRWCDAHPAWISVEDELPKERDWYLIYDTNMGHDVCMWYGDCWGNCYKVTHWMPLPSIEHLKEKEL